jgi:ABC-2 type transport system ATP-binding protein
MSDKSVVLCTISLTKRFGLTAARDGLDLTVRRGEVHAFLGPNGAGKTTTIQILLGLLKADQGQAVLLGGDPCRDAELLLLDEPTAGLDPLMEAAFRDCIQSERQSGRTVLLSSHILAEAEALADQVTIIRAGRTVETGTLTEMRHLTRTTIDAELTHPAALEDITGVHELTVTDGPHLRCQVDPAALDAVLGRLHQAGVRTLTCRPPTLEELFLRHYSTERAVAGAPG